MKCRLIKRNSIKRTGPGTTDLTAGRPARQIIRFALPLVFGTLFQQLYSFADTVIVGRCLGVDALAAVGATYSLNFLTLGFVQGACVGFGIPLSERFGAKDREGLRRYLWNGVWLCAAISLVLSVAMTLSALPLMRLIHTPASILEMSVIYIRIIFIGIPASILYNYSASVLRAMGDSTHPFYFLLVSCLLNIVLDYVLIVPFGMGVGGAAWATVLSQLVSGVLNTWWYVAHVEQRRPAAGELALSVPHLKRLCIVGFPMGFEYSVSAVGAVVMQNAINSLGSVAVAAQTAGEKIRQIFTLPMESVGMAMATYTGQNNGAGRTDRIRGGIRSGLWIQGVCCAAAWVLLFVLKRALVYLVLGDAAVQVTAGAVEYLTRISPLFFLHGALMIFRNVLQGLGYSTYAVISGVGELAGRSLGGWIAVHGFGYAAICYSNPLAWGFALCYCAGMVWAVMRKR